MQLLAFLCLLYAAAVSGTPKALSVLHRSAGVHGFVNKTGTLAMQNWHAESVRHRRSSFKSWILAKKTTPNSLARVLPSGGIGTQHTAVPYPGCMVYVNHDYKFIYVRHPKSASSTLLHNLRLCSDNSTRDCLKRLESGEYADVNSMWSAYFVFSFVRNPWQRALSSYSFLSAAIGHGSNMSRSPSEISCGRVTWKHFCVDPFALGVLCSINRECCKHSEGFMYHHVIDQGRCLLTASGQLAVDFIGRVEEIDDDFQAVVAEINKRIPAGTVPYYAPPLPQQNASKGNYQCSNVTDCEQLRPTFLENAYSGNNSICFEAIASMYGPEISLLKFNTSG